MSKKHKHGQAPVAGQAAAFSHFDEYTVIKHDLVKVVVLNILYLAAILALYYSNKSSHFLDTWFSSILHF